MAEAIGLQQLLNRYLPAYRHPLDLRRRQVLSHLQACRTEAMGGVLLQCDPCRQTQRHYYACRDRHCPLCQWQAAQQWAEKQQAAQLPVDYHHLVFTLPESLNGWVELHPKQLYSLLFQAAWDTLRAFAADPRRLGGQLGMTAVLHTWGSILVRHVHLHCLVPGGAVTAKGVWKASGSHYLFPVRALSRGFRGRLVSRLRACAEAGQLSRITRQGEIDGLLDQLMTRDWVVYSKPCLKAGDRVLRYLARYTHRTAISNGRILGVEKDQVAFRYKDYRDSRWKVMRLDAAVFLRRFLLHVLPKGLMRIRHYGFLANACRARQLPRVRRAIAAAREDAITPSADQPASVATMPCGCFLCPRCQRPMRRIEEIPPQWARWEGG